MNRKIYTEEEKEKILQKNELEWEKYRKKLDNTVRLGKLCIWLLLGLYPLIIWAFWFKFYPL